MATTVDEIQVLIRAQAKDFQRQLNAVSQQLNNLDKAGGKSFKGIGVAGVAAGNLIAKAFAAIGQVVAQSMGDAISRLDTLNNFPKVMSNLGIGAQDAQKSIQVLSDRLVGLPTTLDDAAAAVQRLTAANGNIAASTEMFLAMNNAVLAGGAPAEQQANAIEQMTQAYTKGKADYKEWLAMVQAMPAQLNQVSTAMGYANADQLRDALNSGKVSMNDFMKTIMKLNTEGVDGFQNFTDQAANSTGGVQTSMINLQTALVRGLTQIMNEIGQSNIAAFFNAIGKAIGTAANYVAAFVRLVKEAIGWVQALFGGGAGSTAGLVKETGAAADNMAGVGAGAADAGDEISGANKEAKKLKSTLASFDEMNVLKEPDDGSSGSGSSGSSAAGSFGDFDWGDSALNDVSDKVQGIIDSWKAMFADVDMSAWEGALKTLKAGWDNFAAAMVGIGEKAWTNLFKPLISYLASDFAPKIATAIGNALLRIDVENSVRAWGVAFTGLFDVIKGIGNVVAPVFSIIVDTLSAVSNMVIPPILATIGGVLSNVGNLLKGIGDGIMEVYNNGVKPFLDFVMAKMQPIISYITKTSEEVQKNQTQINSLRTVGEAVGKAIGFVFLGVVAIFTGLAAAITSVIGVFSWLSGTFYGLMGDTDAMSATYKKYTDLLNGTPASQQAVDAMNTKLKDSTNKYNEQLKICDDLTKELNGLRRSQADNELAVLDATDRMTEKQQAYNEAVATYGENSAQAYRASLERQSAEDALANAQDRQAESAANLTAKEGELDTANGKLEESISAGTQAVIDAGLNTDQLNTKLAELAEDGSQSSKDLRDDIIKHAGDMAMKWDEESGKMVVDTDETNRKIKESHDKNKPLINQVFTDVKDWAGKKLQELADGAGQRVEDVKNFWGGIGTWFGEKFDSAKQGMENAFSNVGSWADGKWSDIKGAFGNAWSVFSDIGGNIWEGLKSGLGDVARKMGEIFDGAVNAVKGFLGIHSPSKLFMQFGEYVDQGFAKGLENEMSTVDEAFQDLAGFSVPDVSLGSISMPSARDIEADFDLNTTKQPIQLLLKIDGESIPMSASRIADAINDASFLRNTNVINV
jgi:tape measure domain-containing protein